jgi:hypothetical protein
MLHRSIIIRARTSICEPSKPDISPDWRWRIPMKTMILAALTVLCLGAGVANAQSFAHEMPPTSHQTGQ